jgi:DNA-binding NarL/FixJ family response regulator
LTQPATTAAGIGASDGAAPAPAPVRVLIADAQPLFREGLRLTLEGEGDLAVAGEASSGREALGFLEGQPPDVCVLDALLPVGSAALGFGDAALPGGIELARLIKHRHPDTAVVIMAAEEEEEQLFQAVKVGAAAYCARDIDPQAMVQVIRRVDGGDYLVSDSILARPQVTERVLRQFRELSATASDAAEPLFVPLSQREVEILDYIAHGRSNKGIARELGISDQTVKNHITSILRKLAVNDRTQAVIYALRNNWIKL